ncbi:phospholipase D-like domain-containing protein [Streptomyces sp. NPDC048258]|uniref:phospholipase D-like domain-containing protein n=1 Tax=Streptomyces sp. NPDC048258 TaxID=3365527 RepID=UPI00371BF951
MRLASHLKTSGTATALSAVLLTAGLTPASGAPRQAPAATAATLGVESSGPVFNNPLGTPAEQNAIRSKILQYVTTSPAGSSITVALYHIWDQEVAQALADAHTTRGVHVRLMLDESTVSSRPTDPSYGILRDALGTDTAQPSFVGLCPVGKSCLGRPEFGKSINHNKFWLFSQVDGASDVVLQTSSNMSPSAYSAFWNDAYVVTYNTGLYNAYAGYFSALVGKDWENWRYTSSAWSPYKAYFFPYYPGTGNTTDTIWNTLDNVTCNYTQDGVAKHTKVRVGMFKFTRQGVADKLVALKKAGCSVELVYSSTDSKDSSSDGTTPGTWETLHSVAGLTPVCYHQDHDNNASTAARVMHSKYLLIDGMYDGSINKVLWTGSHNYSGPALRENDEALLKVDDSAAHDAYVANFNTVKAAAQPGTSDSTPQCKGVVDQPE